MVGHRDIGIEALSTLLTDAGPTVVSGMTGHRSSILLVKQPPQPSPCLAAAGTAHSAALHW